MLPATVPCRERFFVSIALVFGAVHFRAGFLDVSFRVPVIQGALMFFDCVLASRQLAAGITFPVTQGVHVLYATVP